MKPKDLVESMSRLTRALLLAVLLITFTPFLSSCKADAFFMSNNASIIMSNLNWPETDTAKVKASAQVLEELGVGHISSIETNVGIGYTYNLGSAYWRVELKDNKGETYCMTLDKEGVLGMVRKDSWSGEVIYLEWADKGAGFETEDQNKRIIFETLKYIAIDDKEAARAAEVLAETRHVFGKDDSPITIGLIINIQVEEHVDDTNLYSDPTSTYYATITDEHSESYVLCFARYGVLLGLETIDGRPLYVGVIF